MTKSFSQPVIINFGYPLTEPDISLMFYDIISEVNAIGCGHKITGSNL